MSRCSSALSGTYRMKCFNRSYELFPRTTAQPDQPVFRALARERLRRSTEHGRGMLGGLGGIPLLDLIPRLSPILRGRKTERPDHLADTLIAQIELSIAPVEGQKFFWFSVPPRHWKSESLKHGAVKHLLQWPNEGVAYCTHTQTFASKQSRGIRRIAKAAGLSLCGDSNRQ